MKRIRNYKNMPVPKASADVVERCAYCNSIMYPIAKRRSNKELGDYHRGKCVTCGTEDAQTTATK